MLLRIASNVIIIMVCSSFLVVYYYPFRRIILRMGSNSGGRRPSIQTTIATLLWLFLFLERTPISLRWVALRTAFVVLEDYGSDSFVHYGYKDVDEWIVVAWRMSAVVGLDWNIWLRKCKLMIKQIFAWYHKNIWTRAKTILHGMGWTHTHLLITHSMYKFWDNRIIKKFSDLNMTPKDKNLQKKCSYERHPNPLKMTPEEQKLCSKLGLEAMAP